MYLVYRVVSPEGKIYVGETSLSATKRWSSGYGRIKELSNDIAAAGGMSHFTKEVLITNIPNHDIALLLEREYILMYKEMGCEVYNKKINNSVLIRLGLSKGKRRGAIVCVET
jgi:hypothetical protein